MVGSFILIPKFYHFSFLSQNVQCTCKYLLSPNANFYPAVSTSLSTTSNIMYLCASRLMNLVLPKVFIQLLHRQVHTPYTLRCDILYSGETYYFLAFCPTAKVTCNLKELSNMQSQHSINSLS